MLHALASRSFFYQAYRRSALNTWWNADAPSPNLFASAHALRYLRTTQLPKILLTVALLATATYSIAAPRFDLLLFTALLAAAYAFPRHALLALPTALLWSPRLGLLGIGNEVLFLRWDHALLAGILCHLAAEKKYRFKEHPIYTPVLAFLIALYTSAMVGILQGTVTMPTGALLYCAQWTHLLLLFVAAHALGNTFHTAGVYAWVLPALTIAVYGICEAHYPYYEPYNVTYRTYERVLFLGQANHYAGFLAIATVVGAALTSERRFRILGTSLSLLATLALFTTHSKTGLLAWAGALAILLLLHVPRLKYITLPAIPIVLLAIPAAGWYRLSPPDSSMFDRLVAWKSALSTLTTHPLLGLGAGARHRSYYDSQFFITLAESGLIGLLLLLLLLATLARTLRPTPQQNDLPRTLTIAACAALAAATIHSIAAISFVITVVAGPLFWWCGYALAQRDTPPAP